jgi:hypothetical protein
MATVLAAPQAAEARRRESAEGTGRRGTARARAYRAVGQRTRYGYRLTEQGAALLPALVALKQWGDRWLATSGTPVELSHRGCGEFVRAELRCAAGHAPEPGELDLVLGPGGRARTDRDRAA